MSEMPATRTARIARKLAVDLSVMTVIGVVLAIIGPFGTSGLPMGVRLITWIGFAWLGYCIYNPMGLWVGWLHRKLHLPEMGLWVAVTLVATVPMAIAVWSLGFLPEWPRMPTANEALAAYINVLVIGASITVLFILIERSKANKAALAIAEAASAEVASEAGPGEVPEASDAAEPVAGPSPIAEPEPKFFERLPPALGTDLLALEMEDHYVRAHTALGSDLILLRMRDAVAELDGVDGSQVHRSWWVARSAVEGTHREGRNLRLKLTGGLEAPVSRNMAPVLKDAGWL